MVSIQRKRSFAEQQTIECPVVFEAERLQKLGPVELIKSNYFSGIAPNGTRPGDRVIQFVDCSIGFIFGWRGQGITPFVGRALLPNVPGPNLQRINSLKASSVDKFLEQYGNIMLMQIGFGTLLALTR